MSLRLKRYYPLIIILIFVVTFFTLVLGNQRIIAYTVQAVAEATSTTSIDIVGDVALFDDTVVHNIQVIISQADYDRMITTYQETGEKDFFYADIIIDGVRINDVGIRLKGNASLRSVLGGEGGMAGAGNDFARMAGAGGDIAGRPQFDPANLPANGERPARPTDGQIPDFSVDGQMPAIPDDIAVEIAAGQIPEGMPAGFAAMGGAPSLGTSDENALIPFLVRFDEFVEGQNYQGITALALRTYGISYNEAMLEEPVTNFAADLAGLPIYQTAYSSVQFNDDDAELYVISEILDENFLTRYFENPNGILYKAEVGSSLSYVNEDPSSYVMSFSQETRVNDGDMAPLIDFMRFLDEADDATFESELPSRLDIDSFATYLALNNLLVNTDSMIGMNNNYYLYYDDVGEQFTVLLWDTNESLAGLGGNQSADYDLYFTSQAGPMMGDGQNTLMERYMSIPAFRVLYEEDLQNIYSQIFASSAIVDEIDRISALIHATTAAGNLVDLDAYDQAVQSTMSFITQRMVYLETTELLGE